MIKKIILILLLTLPAYAEEFQPLKKQPKTTACSETKGNINFAEVKKTYSTYDRNSKAMKILSCEKIQINDSIFYIALFSSEIMEGTEPQKVLTYEVTLLDKKSKSLNTVRSETVDQIDMTVDQVEDKFAVILKTEWGISKKDKSILLKIDAHEKNEKPDPYTLKFNVKSQWFEDVFESTPVKK